MSNIFSELRFSRCREVMASREVALIHLEEREFSVGEPVLISYFDSSGISSDLNTLMAVGVRNGKGKDCYRLITLGQFEVVWGIGRELPDVSSLVHNELYLYQDPNTLIWYYVSAPDGQTRTLAPILPVQHTFLCVADNTIYTSGSDRQIRSITDTYTRDEIDTLLATISGGDFTSLSNLERRLSEAYQRIIEVSERNDELTETLSELQDSINTVNDFAERIDGIERKVDKIEVIEVEGGTEVNGTFNSIQLPTGDESNPAIILDSTTAITTENIGNYINENTEAIPQEILINNLI